MFAKHRQAKRQERSHTGGGIKIPIPSEQKLNQLVKINDVRISPVMHLDGPTLKVNSARPIIPVKAKPIEM